MVWFQMRFLMRGPGRERRGDKSHFPKANFDETILSSLCYVLTQILVIFTLLKVFACDSQYLYPKFHFSVQKKQSQFLSHALTPLRFMPIFSRLRLFMCACIVALVLLRQVALDLDKFIGS